MSDHKKLEDMFLRADWDDTPMRARRGRGKHKQLLLSVVLVCLAFGALANYLDSRQLIQHKTAAVRAAIAVPPTAPVRPEANQRIAAIGPIQNRSDDAGQVNRLLSEPARPITNPEPRQTVFNDANYVPTTRINTISMAQPRVAEPVQPVKPKPGYVTVVKESKPDCFFFKEGSIECRRFKKAVKSGHNQSCYRSENKYSAACKRAELYNPVN
ncbi:hypothetical protein KEM63_10195 [Halopseudomonas nanhaiensis]|uniref:hypothetical protein n=1 Tax=Halopseudomonas nanhaiensis TaxID=2830842 RepID=UPI001CBFC45E|nr:hypothetical protein [Halopseudomonas nanhaiensis]UAW97201.1 hypothetical protein KEM63_10195 [Halopseudomonas nanhaiensis]